MGKVGIMRRAWETSLKKEDVRFYMFSLGELCNYLACKRYSANTNRIRVCIRRAREWMRWLTSGGRVYRHIAAEGSESESGNDDGGSYLYFDRIIPSIGQGLSSKGKRETHYSVIVRTTKA